MTARKSRLLCFLLPPDVFLVFAKAHIPDISLWAACCFRTSMKTFVVCGSFLSIRQARPCVSARCLPSFKNGIALTLRLPKFTVSRH